MNDDLDNLIHRFLDENLERDEQAVLSQLLRDDPAAAKRFAEISILHDTLRSGFRSGALPSQHTRATITGSDRKPSPFRKIQPVLPWLMATAATIVVLLVWKSAPPPPDKITSAPEVRDQGFAVLTHGINPVWSDTSPIEGDFLSAGKLELKSGLAQIEFLSGVLIVLEGDAAIEIISPDEMELVRGKLRALVPPPAIGFQIHTPKGTVVDLGTEFALNLNDTQAELHVLDGEVEWHGHTQEKTFLTEGKGLEFSERQTRSILADPSLFTGPARLSQLVAKHRGERFRQWSDHYEKLTSHPKLLAYFPMHPLASGTRELKPTSSRIQPGAIVGAKIVRGRWPEKQALDFSPNGSRVRVHIPGEQSAITYSVWARIDSLDRQYNALFLTDNYGYGEPHWQILEDGRLFFSVGIGKGKLHHIFHSPVIWDHSKTEQWLHLVTSYDVATRTCVHYLNGAEISRDSAPPEKGVDSLVLGSSQIGNWGLPTRDDPGFAVRNLNGRLDEFAIFNAVLSPEEVRDLYENGRP